MEFDTRLDISTKINVTGPLKLMQLAKECPNFEVFCQVSTLYGFVDRTGFIDEKIAYPSDHDWVKEYERIKNTNHVDIEDLQKHIIRKFPNNYCYTKRMAEELLKEDLIKGMQQGKAVPMVFIRPSIIAAAFSEPVPGWTDSLGLINGFYAIGGHGIMRDLPVNPKMIGDQIPVDYVSN